MKLTFETEELHKSNYEYYGLNSSYIALDTYVYVNGSDNTYKETSSDLFDELEAVCSEIEELENSFLLVDCGFVNIVTYGLSKSDARQTLNEYKKIIRKEFNKIK